MQKLTSLIKSLICASGIVFGLFCPFLSKATKPDDMNEILQLEKVWNEAYLRGDADAIDRLCADDLIVTMTDMQILDKAKSLAIMRSGRVKFKRYETSELRIRVYANAAVVTGRLQRIREAQGADTRDDWRFTKVYIRRNRKWQVVAWHASTIGL